MKPVIIHLFPTPNVYSVVNEQDQPDFVFASEQGNMVAIFRDHWANLLSDSVLEVTDDFHIEIWQPDHHTTKVVSHTFENGLKHVLFPYGVSVNNPEHSYNTADLTPFFTRLNELQGHQFLVQLHEYSNLTTRQYFLSDLSTNNLNLLLQYGGNTYLQMSRSGKNLLRRLKFYFYAMSDKRVLKKVTHAVTMYRESATELSLLYKGPQSSNTMGIDEKYWNTGNAHDAKEKLQLPFGKKIILSASMLRPKKQIKELVETFVRLYHQGERGFYLIIAGGGDKQYERTVKELARPLLEAEMIRFTGRISDDLLRSYYHAADLFVLLSTGEGSPVSVMKAHACEIPVVTTDYGEAPEICRAYSIGLVLPNNPKVWEDNFRLYLNNKIVIKKLGREIAESHYAWKNVAQRFTNLYRTLLKESRH